MILGLKNIIPDERNPQKMSHAGQGSSQVRSPPPSKESQGLLDKSSLKLDLARVQVQLNDVKGASGADSS